MESGYLKVIALEVEAIKIESLFRKLSKKYNPNQIFNDFLELSALSISNGVDFKNYKAREARYIEVARKYSKDELKIFSSILGELTVSLEESPRDVLGDMLMELEEGNKIKGQYFTPFHICLLNAELGFDEEKLNEDGYIFINEPSCGGGALVIALYVTMLRRGFNPQNKLKVIARDLDLKSVLMCYVQLSLLGIPATIEHSNALTCEVFSQWKTPEWILSGWEYREVKKQYKINLEVGENGQLKMV